MTQTSSDTGQEMHIAHKHPNYLCFFKENSFFHPWNVALTHLSFREACRNNTIIMHCMISHLWGCRKKETPVRTETGHLWGSKWEQDEKKSANDNKCTKSDGVSCRWDLGWDEHECHSSHTGADGCYLLWTAILDRPLCEQPVEKTKAVKMEMSICLMAEQLPPSSADVCCTAWVKRNFLSDTVFVWWETDSFFPSVSAHPLILNHTTVCFLHSSF